MHRKCYANITDFSAFDVGHHAPFSGNWRTFCRIGEEMNIMVRHTDTGIAYAPLYVHSFPLIQPHFLVDAEKFNLSYSDLSEIDNTADKLRWCRYHKGLLQRDVANYAGLDRGTSEAMRKRYVTYIPLTKWIR